MMFSKLFTALLTLIFPLSECQSLNTVSFSDPGVGLDISLAIPNAKSAPFPMYMTMTAPSSVGWGGFATGGCMLRSPLILAWPFGNEVMVTTRWAAHYHPPSAYNATEIKLLVESVNATHWSATFLCTSGCSSWVGGSIDPNYNNGTFGYAASSQAPASPSSTNSTIRFHGLAYTHFDWDLTKAKNNQTDVFT